MVIQPFNTPIDSTLVIGLTVLYFLCECISTFDTRIIQAKKTGFLRSTDAQIPDWTGLFGIVGSLTIASLIFLNWKYAIALIVIKFVLKVFPVLENIGAFLLIPVVGNKTAAMVNIVAIEQKKAANLLKKLENQARNKK